MSKNDVKEFGQMTLDNSKRNSKVHLLSIIGELEGHEVLSGNSKTTKYEHVIPSLAEIEDEKTIEGLLILINTIGGDVESGLAIAEMIASISKPTVSLVLGGSHSIGVPLAVASDYSFIVPTGTMLIHPVRMSGMVIGARQTYEYFQRMQDRITGFIAKHSNARQEEVERMMMDTGYMTKDLGTILVGKEAVEAGIIDEVGGIKEAFQKLYRMIKKANKDSGKN
jgi:ATP-dependent protease ClpP protease subunit